MKKLLLLSALAFSAVASQAVTFTVTVMDEEIQNGATVDAKCLVVNEEDFMGIHFINYALLPEVYASASETTEVVIVVKNTTEDYKPGFPEFAFCWPKECIPGIGVPGATGEATGFLRVEPSNLQIDSPGWDYLIEESFTLSCSVNIRSKANPADSFSFKLNMIYDPEMLGVDGVEADDAPATYYDIAGRRVYNPQKGQLVIERRGAKATKRIL